MSWLLSLLWIPPGVVKEFLGFAGSLALLAPVLQIEDWKRKAIRQRKRPAVDAGQRRYRETVALSYDRRAGTWMPWHSRSYRIGLVCLALSFWLGLESAAGWF